MKNAILANLDNPAQLERLYRTDKHAFKHAFTLLYPELSGNIIAECWNQRLNYGGEDISWGTGRELAFVLIASLLAGFLARLPALVPVSEEFFYSRNAGFIIFPLLAAYFAWKNKLSAGKIISLAGVMLAGLVFINLLPDAQTSDTLLLSCIHLPLLLWSVVGIAFIGDIKNSSERRLGYLSYNGDLIVMTTLILITGGLLSGITINLFSLIGMNIEEFYFRNVVVVGLAAAPIVGTYLVRTNPQLVSRISPVIAKIFSPLVLLMLTIYLGATAYSGKDPYNDREFLLIFNMLLIGVMALIFFSIAGAPRAVKTRGEIWVLLLLSAATIVVNGIALSAILFRIAEWGLTPNRAAVLGGNILILTNLSLVAFRLVRVVNRKADINSVGQVIVLYLPVYCVWATVVTFVFPLLFKFQ